MSKSRFTYNPYLYLDGIIRKKVKDVMMGVLGIEEEDITDKANLFDDLGCDSLDVIELIMALEKEFQISIPDSEVEDLPENVCTVSKCIEIVRKHIK